MQREFCPCVAWLLHLFVFWVRLKALSFFMLCIVAEQDGLQAKKGNMLLTYSGVISHGAVFEKGLCFLCLRVTAEGIFILPECPQLPLSLFMYVCVCMLECVCNRQPTVWSTELFQLCSRSPVSVSVSQDWTAGPVLSYNYVSLQIPHFAAPVRPVSEHLTPVWQDNKYMNSVKTMARLIWLRIMWICTS